MSNENYYKDMVSSPLHANILKGQINEVKEICHGVAVECGWWRDHGTGKELDRNDGELIALMHSELSEALEGLRKNLMDPHLPDRPNAEVELADCIIRIMDFAGHKKYDLGGALMDKLKINVSREDHKPENRLKLGGKSF